jgi:hypothetical protein
VLHAPPEHTPGVPPEVQAVPSAIFVVVATHWLVPVVHDVTLSTHAPAGVQFAPAVHAVHWPALQTMFDPHACPFSLAFGVATHVTVLPVQEVAPVLHWAFAPVSVHGCPAVQVATQLPLLSQTLLAPQLVPDAFGVATHCEGPPSLAQATLPVLQRAAWPVSVHAPPLTQPPTQLPLPSHTRFVPHDVPLAAGVAVQIVPVAPHVVAPV